MLQRRVMLMVGRAVLQLVDDSLKLQGVQVVALGGKPVDGQFGDVIDNAETVSRVRRSRRIRTRGRSACCSRSAGYASTRSSWRSMTAGTGCGIWSKARCASTPTRTCSTRRRTIRRARRRTRRSRIGSILKRGRVVEIHADEILLSAANGASTMRMNATDILFDSPHVGIND